ncbi:AbfB domain-containing protein [Streptomyces sp. NPDC002845]
MPGTRRLWLAGGLAVGVLVTSVAAIVLQEQSSDDSERRTGQTTSADRPVVPAVSLPPTPPSGKSGLSSPQPSPSPTRNSGNSGNSEGSGGSSTQQGGVKPTPASEPSASASKPSASKPPAEKPSDPWKSVQSVNYPDRYWHLSRGAIRLDQVSSRSGSETREDSTFKVVPGLADSSCHSFVMKDGSFLRHESFRLRADRNDGSALFKQDATFCARQSFHSGAVMLESVNYPGYFLRHKNFELRLGPVENNYVYWADAAFRLVKGFD